MHTARNLFRRNFLRLQLIARLTIAIIHLATRFASFWTGVWGFSSDSTLAVFLQKLRVHHWRGLRVLVPQRAHTERGGEVSTARSQRNALQMPGCVSPCVFTGFVFVSLLLRQLQAVQWNWSAGRAEPSQPGPHRHHYAVPRVSSTQSHLWNSQDTLRSRDLNIKT